MAKKNWRQTSVDGKVAEIGSKPLQAFLYDLDIEGHALKPGHIRWLETMIVKHAELLGSSIQGRWHVWVFGNTSTTGDDTYNLPLSAQRANEVKKYLDSRLSTIPHDVFIIPMGEKRMRDAGFGEDVEADLFRSVSIVAGVFVEPQPTPDPPRPPTGRGREFLITLLNAEVRRSITDLGIHFDGDVEIRDPQSNSAATYALHTSVELVVPGGDAPLMPEPFTFLRRFDIRRPGLPKAFGVRANRDVTSFEGWAVVDKLKVHRKLPVPGRMNVRLSTDDPRALRAIRITNVFTGPALNIDGVLIEDYVELESADSFVAGTFKLK